MSIASSSHSSDLEQLSRWRNIGARRSTEVLDIGGRVLKKGGMGDQEWSIREQIAIAAFDLGKLKLGVEQLDILHSKFPNSPRVQLLHGLRLEARGDLDGARGVYEALLGEDETNVSAHQRLITLSPSPSTKIPPLLKYLDIFYSDPAGWSLLADLYCELGLYAQGLSALGHLALIQPWDGGCLVRCGEVAYTLGDYQLALKHFLRGVEMETTPEGSAPPEKTKTRAWWGVKLCTKRLLASPQSIQTAVPASMTISVEKIGALDRLSTERLLDAGGAGMSVRRKVLGGIVVR